MVTMAMKVAMTVAGGVGDGDGGSNNYKGMVVVPIVECGG